MVNSLAVIILAAGKGTRLKSNKPKVCQPLAGKSLIRHVHEVAHGVNPQSINIVVGHEKEQVIEECTGLSVNFIEQKEQLGTAHAVKMAIDKIDAEKALVLFGDVPLISNTTLIDLVNKAEDTSLALVLANIENPSGYGRVIRDSGGCITGVVEEKDATSSQKNITEIFSGILCVDVNKFSSWYEKIDNNNSQNEYYLPDIIPLAHQEGVDIKSIQIQDEIEIHGINTREQLSLAEKNYRMIKASKYLQEGISLVDMERVYFYGEFSFGKDCVIDHNVSINNVVLGNNVYIGPNSIIKSSKIADNTRIEANSYIEDANIGDSCIVGPFARVRPGTNLSSNAKIGNFVEVKNSTIMQGSKVNHLSYIGDSTIEDGVNVGAGTITCNYDGANKHQTVIKKGAFIGSGTQLVAPVIIEENATVGAGSTITKNAPGDKLTLSRAKQFTVDGWQRPKKK